MDWMKWGSFMDIKKKHEKLFLAGTMNFIGFLLGLETGGLQFILLKAANEFHLSQAAMGSIVTVQFVAVTAAPLIIGSVSDKIGKKKVIIGASVLCACGSAVNIASANMGTLLAGIVLVGFAFGSLETTITAALSDAFYEKAGKYISIMQGCLSFGAVIAPLFVNLAINQWEFNWRILFWLCMVFSIAGGAAVFFAKFSASAAERKTEAEGKLNLKDMVLMGALILIAVYMIVENGITCFIDTFYNSILQDNGYSAIALSGFWAAMTLSRLLFSMFYEKKNTIIPILCTFEALLLISMNWVTSPILTVGIMLGAGFCCGPMSPFVMNIAVERYPKRSGTVAGLMLGFMGAGGALWPVVGGYIADCSSLRITYFCTGLMAAMEAVIFISLIARRQRRDGNRRDESGAK